MANLDTITTIPVANPRDYVASLSPDKTAEIETAIHLALGLTS